MGISVIHYQLIFTGFQFGQGSLHDAKYIVDEDVVLVTVNYRLGYPPLRSYIETVFAR